MAIVRETSQTSTGSAGPVRLTKPSGVANGDVLVASFSLNGSTVSAAPSGWTLIAANTAISNPRVYGYYKVITDAAGEPASYDWTLTSSVVWGGGITRYSGVDNTTPIDVGAQTDSSSSNTTDADVTQGITTATDNAMVIFGVGSNSSTVTYTATSPLLEVFDVGASKAHMFGDYVKATAGATGQINSVSSSSRAYAAYAAGLKPAAGAPKSLPPRRPVNTLLRR